ncbi:hypothetical protein NUW58_g10382 [Xylaria curta]|uniref:Uncharacterized protein n=1 Tax=Xylaria curta TaxID=42375 RepID=A0ACC1MM15_9PEZI|nr:hypothetical protein NUW58_g10382 [Xylaria curta]
MRDALDLAGAITQAWDDTIGEDSHDDSHADKGTAFKAALDPLIQDFEKAMIGRAEEAAKETWDNLQAFIGEDAANKVAALYQGWE